MSSLDGVHCRITMSPLGGGRKKKKPKVLNVPSFPEGEDGTKKRNLELKQKPTTSLQEGCEKRRDRSESRKLRRPESTKSPEPPKMEGKRLKMEQLVPGTSRHKKRG